MGGRGPAQERRLEAAHDAERHHLAFDFAFEFTFRFNCRRSANRGKLFYRLVQQAVAVNPAPYKSIVKCSVPAEVPGRLDHNL